MVRSEEDTKRLRAEFDLLPEDVQKALIQHSTAIKKHNELTSRIKELNQLIQVAEKMYKTSEEHMVAVQSVGQTVAELVSCLPKDRFIVKTAMNSRSVVPAKAQLDRSKLVPGARVSLDLTTLTIMRILPQEVDPLVHRMSAEDPGQVPYQSIGGLAQQIRELREIVELPLVNPELFTRVGIKPPKGVLLYGPPGTGKTLLARAVSYNMSTNFLKVVASSIVDKYIGESARLIREMFSYAKSHQPCLIFIDEVDAIAGKRFNQGTSADREVQRTLMELLGQLDGFQDMGQVKIIMATNRPDTLDPALLRPGRLDRKIEIPFPGTQARIEIIKIHAEDMTTKGEINYEEICSLCEKFNGADMRNICTEAGLIAIRNDREYVTQEDFLSATRKLVEAKKLEGTLHYEKV